MRVWLIDWSGASACVFAAFLLVYLDSAPNYAADTRLVPGASSSQPRMTRASSFVGGVWVTVLGVE